MSQSRSPSSDLALRWYWPYCACARERTVAPMPYAPSRDRRRVAFAMLVTACVAAGAAYTAWAARRARSGARPGDGGASVAVEDPAAARVLIGRSGPLVMFRNTGLGQGWEQVALVPTASPDQPRTIVPLRCLRLHYAAGRGLCVTGEAGAHS